MKTFLLFFAFTFILLSCNTSSSKKTNLNLEIDKKEITITPVVVEKEIKKASSIDSLNKEQAIDNLPIVKAPEKEVKKIVKPKVIKQKSNLTIPTKKKEVAKKIIKKAPLQIEEKPVALKPNHEIWDELTKTYVSISGKVNYKGFKNKISHLEAYLLLLEKTPPSKEWSKNEKLAYWFNLYNAATVYLVAGNYPVNSIKNINGGKPWDKKFIKSGDHLYTLNDIENKIVRPNYNEPRLHVAFNCAAVSCPNLLNEAFTATQLNTQLNRLSKQWINDPTKNKISKNEIQISQIFNWYKIDFKKGIVSFINTYSNSVTVDLNAKITYLEYNWKLND